jgi:hypothetical protein
MIAQTEQIVDAQSADRKAAALESARLAAVTETEKSKRHEALLRTQVTALTEQAKRLEAELDQVALERDVLAQERDAAKAALAKARNRSSYAVLPHKGPNGTWRRPIILECQNGEVTLQPNGPSFSLLELSMLMGPRSAPIVAAVARELVRSQAVASPDGAPVVPYIFFVVRPDGIKPYYNARAQLEPLGVSFGYELVDQNMEIDYPDLDNLDEWDSPVTPRPMRPGSSPSLASSPTDRPWPAARARGAGGQGGSDSPDTFVWPARPALEGSGTGGGNANGYGNVNGYRNDTTGDSSPGLPHAGRAGADAGAGAVARGPYPPARNGLGRGGSGVDQLPLGTPILDPDNPYDNTGTAGRTAGSPRSGGAPPLGVTGGSAGGWPRSSDGYGTGGSNPPQPGGGPRLIPLSPAGMPGLEDPSAAARASSPAPNDPRGGAWKAARANQSLPPDAVPGPRASGSSSVTQDLAGLAPATGTNLVLPPAPGGDPSQTTQPLENGRGAGSLDPVSGGAPPPPPGGGNVDPNQVLLPPQSQAGGLPAAPSASGGGDPSPSMMPSQALGGNFDPSQGAPPPLSHLAQLAGMTGGSSAEQPSTSKLQSSTAFGIPLPLPSQSAQATNSGDDSDAGDSSSSSSEGQRVQVPRSRSRDKKPMTIDVPFEMVVACGPEGVVIHPGGYRLSSKALKGNDGLLVRELKSIVQTRRQVDPTIHPKPSIRFLVEPRGGETYGDARRQTMLSGLDWPVAIQVSDSDILDNIAPRGSF